MTAVEKADELCRKMLYQIEWNAQPSTVKGVAKACALIAVDEVLSYSKAHGFIGLTEYYEEVKQEINSYGI